MIRNLGLIALFLAVNMVGGYLDGLHNAATARRGITLPPATRFAGLSNTTPAESRQKGNHEHTR